MPLALRKPEAVEPRTIPEWLASRDTALQRRAEDALAGMGMDHATGYLIEIAAQENMKRRTWYERRVVTGLACMVILNMALAGLTHYLLPGLSFSMAEVVLYALFFVPLFVTLVRKAAPPSALQLAALRSLAVHSTGTAALPVFADALWETEESVKEVVIPPLIEMLEQIQSPDALSNRQWATLTNCLTDRTSHAPKLTTYYQKLAVALLNAMERTGYAGCIDSVNRLRTDPPRPLNTSEVFRAADACWLAFCEHAAQPLRLEP